MRFFIECTHTNQTESNSGIQRVVRSIVKSIMASGCQPSAIPVIYHLGKFVALKHAIPFPDNSNLAGGSREISFSSAKRSIKSRLNFLRATAAKVIPSTAFVEFLYAPQDQFGLTRIVSFPRSVLRRLTERSGAAFYDTVVLERGDVLVLLDSSWDTDLWLTVDALRARGILVAVVIYDLVPVLNPEFCTPKVIQAFKAWLANAVPRADVIVGISKTVAVEIKRELPKFVPMKDPAPETSYFWLGSELDGESDAERFVAPAVLKIFANASPTYVYVSTIEPRKNHGYALDAFDVLWARGVKATFLIVGRMGWDSTEFVKRVHEHEQRGKQLFILNDVDDNSLAYIYNTSSGLIFTSFTNSSASTLESSLLSFSSAA